MLVSRPILSEHSEKLKSSCFMHSNGISHSVPVQGVGHQLTVGNIEDVGAYPTGNSCFVPGKIHNDFSSMNIYSSQPSGSSLGSPDSYGFSAGSTGSAPGMMASHYNVEMDYASHHAHLGDGCDMKTGVGDMWNNGYGQPLPSHYPYGNTFGPQYHCDRYYGMDINEGVRRKNATRESTNTLKNWLQEHKKNPYPTKGEKIMLAIVTKMTLTQVSTWFANARRRLKKENKMTWVPKNRSNDANNAGGKKVEDDDETGSQHSQGQKTDGGSEEDGDGVDETEVTSTNDNDVSSTSQTHDSKDELTAKNESAESSSNQTEEDSKQSPLKAESISNCKSIWTSRKSSGGTKTDQSSSISQSFLTEGEYNATSMNIKPQSSMLSPPTMLGHVDSTRLTSHCKYSPNWSASGYQDAVTSKAVSSSQVQTEKPLKEMDRSPRLPDTKPFPPNPMFPMNRPQENISDARSSITATSYLPGFSDQAHSARNYRFSDQLRLPQSGEVNLAYYSQQDKNLRSSLLVSDPNPSSYSGNPESYQSKIGAASRIPTASSISPQQKQHFHQHNRYSDATAAPHYQSFPAKHVTSNFMDMPYQTSLYQQKATY